MGLPPRGIIPAYAGSTLTVYLRGKRLKGSSPHTRGAHLLTSFWKWPIQDHPRIRGEHAQLEQQRQQRTGIIPAYAGSTTPFPRLSDSYLGSSPHTRGARACRCFRYALNKGSSPHTRGALGLYTSFFTITGDHPRIRGEHRRD